jgi:HSP20 family protein
MDRLFSMSNAGDLAQSRGRSGVGMGSQAGRSSMEWVPPLEIVERGNELVVRADLPGLTPDDVQIDIDDQVLTISGERQEREEDRRDGFYRSERSYGAFTRSIALPEGVDEEQVSANFEHGVLEIHVPLPDPQRPRGRRVQVQSGGTRSGQQGGTRSAAPGGSTERGASDARDR